MRIRKYDFNWGRRELMKKVGTGVGAGLLMPMTKVIAEGKDLSKAYPDELMSIDMYTKGKVKAGDTLTADNVDIVKDLLDDIVYEQIKHDGRRVRIRTTVTNPDQWGPKAFLDRTRKNQQDGIEAALDADGNLVTKSTGGPWVGGLPFPNPKSGLEAQYNAAVSWGRHDYSQYAITERDYGPDGRLSYKYDLVWAALQVQGRTDSTVFQNKKDLLRYQTVLFTASADVAGTSFMSTWYADQRKFPQLIGYLPQFRRTRTFPASQRFEPLIPGVTWFLSDAWAAGDPALTWGEYKIVARKPMLGAFNTNWYGDSPNWEPTSSGGPGGKTYLDYEFDFAPECIVLDSKPVKYPRSPVGYRRTWMDTRNMQFSSCVRYDRNGKLWVNFEGGLGQYVSPKGTVFKEKDGSPAWSWIYVQSYDIQRKRMSHIMHTQRCFGGYESSFDDDNDKMYQKWFTQEAIQRLGSV